MNQIPASPFTETKGMVYFARMVDKIRKHAAGELHADYHGNLGKALDRLCIDYLRVDYNELKMVVLKTSSDEEALEWCFEKGRELNKTDLLIWNTFMKKAGHNDFLSEKLQAYKEGKGWGERSDIKTLFAFLEADEGRLC